MWSRLACWMVSALLLPVLLLFEKELPMHGV